jgi:hypothetical protein
VIDDFAIQRLDEVGPEQWDAYRRIVIRPRQAGCPHGQYATDVRKRRSADAKGTDRKGQEL